MANAMVEPNTISDMPGGPFTATETDVAVASVQEAAGWHIAPIVNSQVVTLDIQMWETRLRLPTRKLLAINSITDVDSGDVIDPSLYRVSLDLGQVERKGIWPLVWGRVTGYWRSQFARIEVDFKHGYTTAPQDLVTVVAAVAQWARRDQSVQQQAFNVPYEAASPRNPFAMDNTFERKYSLYWIPGIA